MKYTIIKIDDRASELVERNKLILKGYDFVTDIKFFDGRVGKAWDVINHRGIRQDVWKPYDGRTMPPLPGELGIWVSTLNVFDYIIENELSELLVLEDDVELKPNFVEKLERCRAELPEDYDFLALHWFEGHNQADESTEIGSKLVHRSFNQFSAGQAILYSLNGARKLKKAVQRLGIVYTTDCFIFRQSLDKVVSGFSLKPDVGHVLQHKTKIQSTIDPNNERNT